MNAGRRNQSSATLSSKNGAVNGKINGEPPVSRRGAPQLQRSKSDYGPRGEEAEEHEEDGQDWGARHGFDGHYASDEFVSQLVHVSGSFHTLFGSRGGLGSSERRVMRSYKKLSAACSLKSEDQRMRTW